MEREDYKDLLGFLGNLTAICLFLSPAPTIIEIVSRQSAADHSGLTYVCTLLHCLLWVVYGLPLVEFHVWLVTVNGIGCVIEVMFLSILLTHAQGGTRKQVSKVLLTAIVAFVLVTLLVLVTIDDHHERKTIFGTLCAVYTVGMYFSPLEKMRMVIQNRSVEYMPNFLLSLCTVGNGIVWFSYAIIGEHVDIYIAIPNSLGVLSGVAQLSLHSYFSSARHTET